MCAYLEVALKYLTNYQCPPSAIATAGMHCMCYVLLHNVTQCYCKCCRNVYVCV